MHRRTCAPRRNWQRTVEELGFDFHTFDGEPYWVESAYYEFTLAEIEALEAAANDLHQRCLEAVDHVIARGRIGEMGIPPPFHDYVAASWRRRDAHVYGRFDFCFDGEGPPKLLEYNADTPTALLEASVVQWQWLEETRRPDQFISIHEAFLARWAALAPAMAGERLHFSCVADNAEDRGTIDYLRDTALQSRIDAQFIAVEDVGWDGERFTDREDAAIRNWCKLYPWEWLFADAFGGHLPQAPMRLFEPPWKAVVANKAILAVLWELFPDHPNLLPARLGSPEGVGADYAKKPIYGREGANMTLVALGQAIAAPDAGYGNEGYVYQRLAPLPTFDGQRPVCGVWVVGDDACGLGIRESAGPITDNDALFLPHCFT